MFRQGFIQDFRQEGAKAMITKFRGGDDKVHVVIGYFYEAMWKHASVTPRNLENSST